MHLRFSPTTVEQYRLFREKDFVSVESLDDSIKGVFKPNWKMNAGTAVHGIAEDPPACRRKDGLYHYNGWVFAPEVIQPFLDTQDRTAVYEVPYQVDFDLGRHLVTISGRTDAALGLRAKENKTKWFDRGQSFDLFQYADSCQPKFYFVGLEPVAVDYTVACFTCDGEFLPVGLKSIEQFTLYPYPGVRDDCHDLLSEFVQYVESRNLLSYLRASRPSGYKRAA
jgi:hypothetical protein